MSSSAGDEPTPGEQRLNAELLVKRSALEQCMREWVEHYYAGGSPENPRPYRDALRVVGHPELFPAETVAKADVFLYALEVFGEQIEIVKAEIVHSRPEWLEELNREREELWGGGAEEDGAWRKPT